MLQFLIENRTRVVSKEDVIEAVWDGRCISDSALTYALNAVRKAVGDDGKAQAVIRTVPRHGFRFLGEVSVKKSGELTVQSIFGQRTQTVRVSAFRSWLPLRATAGVLFVIMLAAGLTWWQPWRERREAASVDAGIALRDDPSLSGLTFDNVSAASAFWIANQTEVDGSAATMVRMSSGAAITLATTGLQAGDVVTVWVQVFNSPYKCFDGECGWDDIFIFGDGTRVANFDARSAAEISVLRLDGKVIDIDGKATFRGRLPVGDTSQAIFGPGLVKPMGAQVHLIVRTHQAEIPGMLEVMLSTPNGGCAAEYPNEPCQNVQIVKFFSPEAEPSN